MDNFLILKERHIIDTEWSMSIMTKTLKTGRRYHKFHDK